MDSPTPWVPSADECNSILAWDSNRERIACDARGTAPDGGPGDGEVRIFDLIGTDAVPQLDSNAVKALTDYQQGDSIAHRRSFSASGNWLAFTTDTSLYIGNVQQAPQVQLQVALPYDTPPSTPSELAFSPDEAWLLWQIGGEMGVYQLLRNGITGAVGADAPLLSPEPCNEEFTAGPSKWCGRLKSRRGLVWSTDSHFVAATTATYGVRVYDLQRYSLGTLPYADVCQTGCSDDFAFQP